MADSNLRKELMDEILSRKLGDKKSHSETSLQQYGDNEDTILETNVDPGVLNSSMNPSMQGQMPEHRRRTMSQPGPVSGSLLTATAARAARRRPPKYVVYASDFERAVLNSTMNSSMQEQLPEHRRRTMSQPGPVSGSLLTATAARTARQHLAKYVVHATDFKGADSERQIPKLNLPSRSEESASPTPTGEFQFNGGYRNGDVKSLNSYRLYAPSENRGAASPRKRSVATMDAQSLRSVETQAPPSTDPHDNKKMTIKSVTIIMSCTYAIFLVTLGIIIHSVDSFHEAPTASAIYSIILMGIGFLYHVYLMIDISRYKKKALKNQKIKGLHEEKLADLLKRQEEDFASNLDRSSNDVYINAANFPSPVLNALKHDYCFSQGRHSGSFYLKLGAAGFALGHLIHSVLLIAIQINFFLDEAVDNNECAEMMRIVLDVMNPFYCFFQLFFIFKYSNVIILRAQGLARFAFMHMIGSSICFWFSTIVRETVLALTIYAQSVYGNDDYGYDTRELAANNNRFFDVSSLYNENCTGSTSITSIFDNISPYLYPFSVEFNILIVAVYYIIWNNVGNCDNSENDEALDDTSISDKYSVCKIPTANEENDFTSNIVIHADCHASNRGLFLGLILMVIIAGMLIIGFVFSSVGESFLELGYLLSRCTSLGLHIVMLFASVIAYNQTSQLDINEHPVSLLDDILLFICLPAFFLEIILSLVATINLNNIIYSVDFVVMVVQVVIQTSLIVDGLRRCSNSRKLRRKKPGRELIIFLLIANVAMWLFNTFSYKSPETLDERYEYYGKVVWTILGHVSLPLIMFYRFHSSVCFADIWNSAYTPGLEH